MGKKGACVHAFEAQKAGKWVLAGLREFHGQVNTPLNGTATGREFASSRVYLGDSSEGQKGQNLCVSSTTGQESTRYTLTKSEIVRLNTKVPTATPVGCALTGIVILYGKASDTDTYTRT